MQKISPVQKSLQLVLVRSFVSMVFMVAGIILSNLAFPLEQEIGMAKSILGGNRDWLVAAKPWFIAGFVASLLGFSWALLMLRRKAK